MAIRSNELIKKEYTPGTIFLIYLLFSVLFFLIAPFSVYYINISKTVLYAVICWSSFGLGYFINNAHSKRYFYYKNLNIDKLYKNKNNVIIAISIFIIVINFLSMLSLGYEFSIRHVLNSLNNLGEAYFFKWEVSKQIENDKNIIIQVFTLTYFVQLILIPTLIIYWREIKRIARIISIIAILLRILPGLITGTLINIFVVVLEIVTGILTLTAIKIISKYKRQIIYSATVLLIILFIIMGTKAMISRADYLGWAPWQGTQPWYYNPKNIMSKIMGDRIGFGINSLFWYLGHGYEGLGQCLELPFVWTYGIGHSRALMEYADQYLGWEWIWDRHYLWRNYRITGRHPLMYWPTALVWLASDVTFFGVIVVLYFVGKFTRKIWNEVLTEKNPISLALFNRMVLMILFLPMNLQIFQGRVLWWGSIGLILVYIIKKRQNTIIINKNKTNNRGKWKRICL